MIIGPFNAAGARFSCSNRDVCNGAFVDGQYVYVGSDTFPYVVGCWGPGPNPDYKPCCTNSGCGDKASTCSLNSALDFGLAGISVASAALFLF